ncbi:Type IV fimbrial assembly, ATPase PilB [Candidatus Sumerlaea chitinivorans]|uniref:protein-secreting ATPase n=1 Tax=Sumerlaea chitinivorans TaxID=2250252 RepID=A0A2Z4Y335_SUMC1|nr:Type IV fimbrial assembly, ATPase PilB [Candidatus Sumerlaea chitinivorans]
MLVRDNVITQDELEHALELQEKQGGSLGSILIDNKYANEWEIAAAIGKQLNVPFITLSHYEIDPSILKSIPEDLVRKYQIVPIDKTGDTLTVALSDPSNIYLLDELRLLTNCKIVPVISFESDIKEAIERYYPKSESALDEMLKEISDEETAVLEALESGMTEPAETEVEEGEVEATDAPVIQLVNLIVHDAIRMRASDIHIEPYEKELRLRYRIDGVLHEMKAPPKKFQNAIVSRIKIMSDLDIAERRLPQDGRFKVTVQGRSIDFRVSTCPTVFGEKVVIRILDRGNLMLNLTDLGMDPEVLAGFEAQIRAPWGMILVTGPTGSGKSTTLYSALNTINDPRKNIMTIEDPVEYQLRGINQVQVHPEIGLTFAEGLRSFLRQDPDIIMVGEIRDKETAEIAVKAALTGHLVLSTLHTNDAPSTINRLTNMGVEAFLVTASVNLIVAQRLVRRICENCKQFYDPPAELLRSLQIPEDAKFARGAGCDRCLNSGYKGRVALYELLHLSDAMRDKIIEGISTTQLKRMAIQEGMITLRRAGLQKVAQGVTTIDEVLSVTAPDER